MLTAPPTLTDVSPAFMLGREGSGVEMRCDATGLPPPTVTWLKDGNQLGVAESPRVTTAHEGRRLVVSHLMRADAGVYTCLFKNTVAQASHSIRLVVEGNFVIIIIYFIYFMPSVVKIPRAKT